MNILLTDKCTNNCPYCFAKEKLEEYNKLNQMSLENYKKVLEFHKKSEIRRIKLIGGEPMLHSNIAGIINMTIKDDAFDNITVLTGGIFPGELIPLLSPQKISVLLNANHPSDYKNGNYAIFIRNLDSMASLGIDITLGYNIYKTDFDYDFILELLEHYKIKDLRWTIAVPIASSTNRYLPFEDYQKMGRRLTEFLLKCGDSGVEPRVDCFVPFCTFTNSDYGKLNKKFPDMLGKSLCTPAFDVGPDLCVWRCFALSDYENVNLENFSTLKELKDFFISSFDHYKWCVYPKRCERCKYRLSRSCQSSCIAFKAKEIKDFLEKEKKALSILEESRELYSKKEHDSAHIKYKEALSTAPESIKILRLKAESSLFHIKLGNLSMAKDIINEIEIAYPDFPPLYLYRGLIYEKEKTYGEAIKNYRKALKWAPDDKDLNERIEKITNLQTINLPKGKEV